MYKLFVKGVRGKYFKVIKDMFDNSKSRVKYNSQLSDIFENLHGVLQGGVISPTLFNFFLDDLSEYLDKSKGIKVGTITVCHMLFADDLILASETPSGLQKLINGLEEFCKQWHMEVNLSKTSISIFNKKFQIYKQNYEFKFFENIISETNEYNYLGITFSTENNRFRTNYQRLKEKALRAIYAARNLAHKAMGNHITPNVLFKIYDSQIQPILDYGSEVWYQGKNIKELEVVHTGFLKKTLGVKLQTSTLAVYGECGRFPLELRQKELTLKYWRRLLKLPIDNPLHIVYKKLIQLHTLNRNWCSVVFDILRSLGFENLLEAEADLNVADIDGFNRKLKLSLQNSYADYWRNEIRNINEHPILRTYSLFKTAHISESYLSINMDTTYKKCIARFRVSSHRLGIETGRHQKPPIPVDNRVCAYCPGPLLDDELHLITQCRYHLTERTKLYDTAKMHIAEFGDCSNYDKFALILGSQSAPVLVALGNFLYTCFRKRNTWQVVYMGSK